MRPLRAWALILLYVHRGPLHLQIRQLWGELSRRYVLTSHLPKAVLLMGVLCLGSFLPGKFKLNLSAIPQKDRTDHGGDKKNYVLLHLWAYSYAVRGESTQGS